LLAMPIVLFAMAFPLSTAEFAISIVLFAIAFPLSTAALARSPARTFPSWAAIAAISRAWGEMTRGAMYSAVRPMMDSVNGDTILMSQ